MAASTQSISPLQVYRAPKSWAGMIDTARLTDALQTEPHKMGMFMAYHFGYEYNNFLNLITGGLGQTKIIEGSTYDWYLHSQNMRALPLLDNMESGNTTPGFGGMPFRVIFSEKYFDVTDVLISDDRTQCRIITEPQAGPSGGYVYTLQLMKANRNAFIDPSQIARGARFSKMFSVVAEGSDRGGSTTYHNPFLLKNQLTTLRKQFEITGSAAVEKMVFEIPYMDKGTMKTTKYWCSLAEYTAMNQFYAEVDKSLFYGEYNRTGDNTVVPKDLNGRPIFIGAGLREQIAPANRRYYSSLTYNILNDFLMDLSYNRKEWGGNMRFLALTGKMGMEEFNRAIEDKARSFSNLIISDGGRFISGTGMDLTFGSQFKTVKFPNGIELTVANFEPYDDLTDNRILHPVSQRPVESYRFTIMNIGQKEGNKANIQKVVKRDREMVMWSENGSIDIGGTHAKSLNQGRSNAKDGAVGHILSECGIMLGDPTSCGELILNIE